MKRRQYIAFFFSSDSIDFSIHIFVYYEIHVSQMIYFGRTYSRYYDTGYTFHNSIS